MKKQAKRMQVCGYLLILMSGVVVHAQLPPIDYSYLKGLPAIGVPREIIQDQRGMIWMGYSQGGTGLYVYDGNSVRQVIARPTDSTSLVDVSVNSILETQDGKIWIGTLSNGIAVYDPGTDLFSHVDIGQKTGTDIVYVHDIYEAEDGYLWMGTAGGLIRYDPGDDTYRLFRTILSEQYSDRDIEHTNHIRCVKAYPADADLLWLGTLRGLVSFNKNSETFELHTMPFDPIGEVGLPHAQFLILDIEFFDDTHLIAGSWAGGIITYNTQRKSWKQFRDPMVPPAHDIYYDIEVKDTQTIWICANKGFGTFSFDNERFSFYDSIPSAAQYRDHGWSTAKMLFLNARDLIVLGIMGGTIGQLPIPSTFSSPILYPPQVRTVYIDESLSSPINNTYPHHQISLSSNQTSLRFEIVAPHPFGHDSIQYRYLLTGYDRNWITHSGTKQIRYDGLRGGQYQLQYQASLDGKTWIDGESWSIEKFNPFWRAAELKFIAGGVFLVGFGLYLFLAARQRHKQKQIEKSFRHLLAESEMSALRAQMNPHFIFNSLNSIKTYVLKQETAVANKYLTRFAHLMRLVLRNSKSRLITLTDELHALELYLEIEKLRFDDGFSSTVDVDEAIDPEAYYIPPMLVQPYVENAIWHGLMHKKESGLLHITIFEEKETLHIVIQDNGVGRTQSAQQQNSETGIQKSFGTQITHDRIALIRQSLNIDAEVRIDDLYDDAGNATGTRVHLMLPHIDPRSAKDIIDRGVQTSKY